MNVVYLSILVYIVILLPCITSDTRCPAKGIDGCWCYRNDINCKGEYTGEDVPVFSKSNTTYYLVSYE